MSECLQGDRCGERGICIMNNCNALYNLHLPSTVGVCCGPDQQERECCAWMQHHMLTPNEATDDFSELLDAHMGTVHSLLQSGCMTACQS